MSATIPYTHELVEPIARRGSDGSSNPITHVTITRKPRLKDLRKVAQQRDEVGQNAAGLECLTDLPKQAIEELGLEDFTALSAIIGPLFSGPEKSTPPASFGDALDAS